MKNIQIRSKPKAAEFTCDEKWAAISVSTRPGEWPELKTENRVGLLQLSFLDFSFVSDNLRKQYPDMDNHIFNATQAEKILEFMDGVKDEIDTLLVHCEAGISRSPAIAAAIDKIYLGNDAKRYFREYRPNILVYHVTTHVAEDQGRLVLTAEDNSLKPVDLEFVDEVPLEIIG